MNASSGSGECPMRSAILRESVELMADSLGGPTRNLKSGGAGEGDTEGTEGDKLKGEEATCGFAKALPRRRFMIRK
jgi:hypothetical protein